LAVVDVLVVSEQPKHIFALGESMGRQALHPCSSLPIPIIPADVSNSPTMQLSDRILIEDVSKWSGLVALVISLFFNKTIPFWNYLTLPRLQ
jgi:hypothetical protein